MTWKLREKEFAAVSALDPPRRYAHFIKRVAAWEEVWSLRSDQGWVMSGDDDGHEAVPVWPHSQYAAACATGHWAGSEPESIDLDEWMQYWLPGIERDGLLIGVFLTPDNKGVVDTPARLRADLEQELAHYPDDRDIAL